jgi:hypothetical protein
MNEKDGVFRRWLVWFGFCFATVFFLHAFSMPLTFLYALIMFLI